MLLINNEIIFVMTWSATVFAITGTELIVPVVIMSTQDNAKLLEELKPGFEKTTKLEIPQSEVLTLAQYLFLKKFIDPSFQGVNRLFVLLFKDCVLRMVQTEYVLPKLKIKDYNVIIGSHNFVNQLVKDDIKTYEIATAQGKDYEAGCMLNYTYFNENCKLIAIDLRKQQALAGSNFHRKSRTFWEYNNVLQYQRSKRNFFS